MPEERYTPPETSDVLDPVEDEAEKDELVPFVAYDVTSYGSDPDVEGLVRRIKKEEIFIPPFQRDYVWRQAEASKFVESLLLGLPVPGIFLATDPTTNKMLVIDGQQRLKSLMFYYDGFFNPKEGEKRHKVFSLIDVQERFKGKTYKKLEEKDRLRLDNSVIHATIVKQVSPPGDDTSVYHIFARLNSGGRRLAPQEIRVALYHGPLMNTVRKLNENIAWRNIIGKPHQRMKDQELILRFMALYKELDKYSRPMGEFINKYAGRNKMATETYLSDISAKFINCCTKLSSALGKEIFRPSGTINAAVFDSCMVGLAYRLENVNPVDLRSLKSAYELLLKDKDYWEAVSRSTADNAFVVRRVDKAKAAFASI